MAVERRDAEAGRETGRLEAFSDGVLAVIITIMALELKAPVGAGFRDLRAELPNLLIYLLSFVFIGIYWNNHHHLLRAATRLSTWVMWSNLHLLFWLSLLPVLTQWVGDHWRATAPAATYSVAFLGAALAYTLLQLAIIQADGPDSRIAAALGSDTKGRISIAASAAGFGAAFVTPIISYALLGAIAVMWFVPDRRLDATP